MNRITIKVFHGCKNYQIGNLMSFWQHFSSRNHHRGGPRTDKSRPLSEVMVPIILTHLLIKYSFSPLWRILMIAEYKHWSPIGCHGQWVLVGSWRPYEPCLALNAHLETSIWEVRKGVTVLKFLINCSWKVQCQNLFMNAVSRKCE